MGLEIFVPQMTTVFVLFLQIDKSRQTHRKMNREIRGINPHGKRKHAHIKSVREMQIKITTMYIYTHQTGKKKKRINSLYW